MTDSAFRWLGSCSSASRTCAPIPDSSWTWCPTSWATTYASAKSPGAPKPLPELLEEVEVEVDLLVGRAVERARLRARRAAARCRAAGEQDERRRLVRLARPLERVRPQAVGVVEDVAHELDLVAVVREVRRPAGLGHAGAAQLAEDPAETAATAARAAAREQVEHDDRDDDQQAAAAADRHRDRDPAHAAAEGAARRPLAPAVLDAARVSPAPSHRRMRAVSAHYNDVNGRVAAHAAGDVTPTRPSSGAARSARAGA